MVKTKQAIAQVPQSATTPAAVFTAAQLGSAGAYSPTALNAFVTANGGMANINVQLLPIAIKAGAFMHGANFLRNMQPANGNVGHFGQMLWVMVNGGLTAQYWQATHKNYVVPTKGFITSLNWLNTTVPTKIPAPVPLAMVNAIAANSGSSIKSALVQNPVLKCLAGGTSPSSRGWGVPLVQLVATN